MLFVRYAIHLVGINLAFSKIIEGETIGQPNEMRSNHLTQATSPLSQFWIAGKLNGVDWYQLMSDVVPHLGTDQKEGVLNIAGYKNINPLFIITHLVLEHQSSLENPSSDSSEINESVRKMTDLLHEQFLQTGDDNGESRNQPVDELAKLRNVLDGNDEKLKAYVELYGELFSSYVDNPESSFVAPIPEDREDFSLTWPWPVNEQWMVGGTHGHNGIWSSLDMNAFGGQCLWKDDDCKTRGICCVEATPDVLAMSSGTVSSVITKCQIRIVHSSGQGVKYYHMAGLRFKPGDYVQKGQAIGKYAGDYPTALCDGGKSEGPHLHMDLVDSNGDQLSLHNRFINGYRVNAGIKEYDTDCSRCWFEKGCIKYCPYGNPAIIHDAESGSECYDRHNRCTEFKTKHTFWFYQQCTKNTPPFSEVAGDLVGLHDSAGNLVRDILMREACPVSCGDRIDQNTDCNSWKGRSWFQEWCKSCEAHRYFGGGPLTSVCPKSCLCG